MTIAARVLALLGSGLSGMSVGALGRHLREPFEAVLESCVEASELVVHREPESKAGTALVELVERARCPACRLPLAVSGDRLTAQCVSCLCRVRCYVVSLDVVARCWSVYPGWNSDPDKPIAQCRVWEVVGVGCSGRLCADVYGRGGSRVRGGGCAEIWACGFVERPGGVLRFC